MLDLDAVGGIGHNQPPELEISPELQALLNSIKGREFAEKRANMRNHSAFLREEGLKPSPYFANGSPLEFNMRHWELDQQGCSNECGTSVCMAGWTKHNPAFEGQHKSKFASCEAPKILGTGDGELSEELFFSWMDDSILEASDRLAFMEMILRLAIWETPQMAVVPAQLVFARAMLGHVPDAKPYDRFSRLSKYGSSWEPNDTALVIINQAEQLPIF